MKGLDTILVWIVLTPCITSGKHIKWLVISSHTIHMTEANQSSHHGHRSYNIQGMGHVLHRPPTNVTATNGVGVDFMCKVMNIGFTIINTWL